MTPTKSSHRKQLLCLLFGVAWVTVALIYTMKGIDPYGSFSLTYNLNWPLDVAEKTALLSIPGVLLSGVGFWWYGRNTE
jgi:hypothetical protein